MEDLIKQDQLKEDRRRVNKFTAERMARQNKDKLHERLEDLNSSGMIKNHKLAKSISDASFFEFNRELEYKARWNYKLISRIDRFYPSSQLCSNCGSQSNQTKDLGCRTYICEKCGLKIDRDYNASINILNEGLRKLEL